MSPESRSHRFIQLLQLPEARSIQLTIIGVRGQGAAIVGVKSPRVGTLDGQDLEAADD